MITVRERERETIMLTIKNRIYKMLETDSYVLVDHKNEMYSNRYYILSYRECSKQFRMPTIAVVVFYQFKIISQFIYTLLFAKVIIKLKIC